jgi:2-dehydro-3-deoxyphosphooctonate aldolase (KDO 8-P synthase)
MRSRWRALKEIADAAQDRLVFKTSFDKANRTSARQRGIGLEGAARSSPRSASALGLPVLTDVHDERQCAPVAEVVDVLQIPAFSAARPTCCRRRRDRPVVNVKKGQFLAPWDMVNVIAKITDRGNPNVMLTERGRLLRLQHAGLRHAQPADHGARSARR